MEGARCRVEGAGCKVQGAGCRVWGGGPSAPQPMSLGASHDPRCVRPVKGESFIDKLLVRIHSIIDMILVDRPCAMGI